MQVYADNAATTKMRAVAIEEMTEAMRETYGNPSGVYSIGREAKEALESSRYMIAQDLGAKTNEIFFTSGGSESNTQAILSAAAIGAQDQKVHVITTNIEHDSVLNTMRQLQVMRFEVSILEVDENGYIDPVKIHEAIRPNTALVSVMMANNEIGTIQNINQIGAICAIEGVLFHTDAVQAAGHLPIDVKEMNIDLLSLSAHKFGGPKGVGALYASSRVNLSPLILGGPQERGKRAGTENVPGAVGMAAALDEACENLEASAAKVTKLRDKLIAGLLAIPGTKLNGGTEPRLPGNVNVCFDGVESESLLVKLDEAGICASAGSACQAGSMDPSHVLLAIGRTEQEALHSLRLSLNEDNTEEEVDYLISKVTESVESLRR